MGIPMKLKSVLSAHVRPCSYGVFLGAMLSGGYGQAEISTLSEIHVVAPQDEKTVLTVPSVKDAKYNLSQIAGGANVVDAEVYKTGRASTLQDALGYSPGVFVQSRFGAEEARLSIRGSGLQRTFHLRGIQLLQDGVPLNQADGGGDFQAVDPLAARYIEVYRGANALRYGASTLGGAINFVTPTGYDAAPLQARLERGSFDYTRAQASVAGVANTLDYFASASFFAQEGYRDHARQDTNRVFGNMGWRINPNLESRFYFAAVDTDSELPGNLTKSQLKSNPQAAQAINVTNNYKRDFKLYRLANKTTWQYGDTRVDGGVFIAQKDLFHPIFQVIDQHNLDYGADLRLTRLTPLAGRANSLTLGLTLQRNETEDDRFVNVGGRPGARTNKLQQEVNTVIAYAENQYHVMPKWIVVAGAQAMYTTREQTDEFITGGVNEGRDKSYRGVSPKVGFRYEATPTLQFFGNVARSLEPPSFPELTSGPTTAPVFADAQTATTFEVGSRGKWGIGEWDAVLYRSNVNKELLSLIDPVTAAPLGTINADKTLHQGIEFGLDLILGKSFLLKQAYLFNDFRFKNDPAFGNNDLAGIPRQFYKAELLYRQGGYYFGPNVEWSPQKYYVDHANTVYADPYATVGVKLGFRNKQGWAWFIEGRNLSDRKYASTTGIVANAAGVDQAQYLPGDGRALFAGIEWRD